MVLLSSRLMFVYNQVPISQVKSQTAILCNQRPQIVSRAKRTNPSCPPESHREGFHPQAYS